MKRTSTIVFFLLLATCATLVPSGVVSAKTRTSSKPIRFRFLQGAISAQARGQLTKNKNADAFYVIRAKAGDHMIVNIIALSPGLMTSGDVTSPSGAQEGQHGGIIFNADLSETGDYTIRVARNLMGTERPDGSFILEVVITPSYLKN